MMKKKTLWIYTDLNDYWKYILNKEQGDKIFSHNKKKSRRQGENLFMRIPFSYIARLLILTTGGEITWKDQRFSL